MKDDAINDGEKRVEKPYISNSQLEMLSKCGEQYRRRYIEHEKIPPGVAMIVGSSVDASVNGNLIHKVNSEALLPMDAVDSLARDYLEKNWATGISLNDDEVKEGIAAVKGAAIDKAVRLSRLHAEELAPIIQPISEHHIQLRWTIELINYPMDLVGVIDIEEEDAVRDTKTSKKSPNKNDADKSPQLTTYALKRHVIDKKKSTKVILDYLVDNKTPAVKTLVSERTEEDFKVLLRRVENAIEVLDKGAFVPARSTDWVCDPKWCGYYKSCKYVNASRLVQIS